MAQQNLPVSNRVGAQHAQHTDGAPAELTAEEDSSTPRLDAAARAANGEDSERLESQQQLVGVSGTSEGEAEDRPQSHSCSRRPKYVTPVDELDESDAEAAQVGDPHMQHASAALLRNIFIECHDPALSVLHIAAS